jgi:hypothetical protein
MAAGAMVVSALVLAVMRAPAGGGRHYGVVVIPAATVTAETGTIDHPELPSVTLTS